MVLASREVRDVCILMSVPLKYLHNSGTSSLSSFFTLGPGQHVPSSIKDKVCWIIDSFTFASWRESLFVFIIYTLYSAKLPLLEPREAGGVKFIKPC